ncbi:calcium-activated chloride channel regulator 1-like [Ptychodera flava]|uniref:calcium-activated chloride channel regulator 1-like n=1 Tax=Ptychodera flava TaxID=63121 RepID=UPI003969E219
MALWQCLLVLLAIARYSGQQTEPTVGITLRDNGYEGIVVAIHRDIEENAALLERIKAVFTEASETLYRATNNRAFYRNITILVPSSWSDDDSKYEVATTEMFDSAKVQIAPPHPLHGDVPYVQQVATCGEPGNSIHLTDKFFLDPNIETVQGPRRKVIVHEWGHLRWGLFDEYVVDDGEYQFYRDGGVIRPVGCVKSISSGEVYGVDADYCKFLIENRKPPPPSLDCTFIPAQIQDENVHASFMYAQWIESVDSFCNSDRKDTAHFHARKAPNRQNRFCNGKSAWEVMKDHTDFKDDVNSPADIPNTEPTFKVVRSFGARRVVLILDTSGSMRGTRILIQHQVAVYFIENTIEDGSFVGIVRFSDSATVLAELTEIKSNAERQELVAKVPKSANGATSIGAGLEKGLEVFQNANVSSRGSSFLLVTDGQENHNPYIADVIDKIDEAGVLVDTVSYTSEAKAPLRELSDRTGGRYFYVSQENDVTGFLDSFAATITERPLDNYENIPITLESNLVSLQSGMEFRDVIYVDSAVGNNTVFTFLFSESPVDVSVASPSGVVYNDSYPGYKKDIDLKRVEIKVKGVAEAGEWTYTINTDATSQDVTVVLESKMKTPGDEPIRSKGYLGKNNVNFTDNPTLVIIAEVRKGYLPVLKANVAAIVDRPRGETVTVVLRDNGAGADISKDDGIYSAYFLDYIDCRADVCKYGVKIKVTNTDGSATVKSYTPSSSPALVINPGYTQPVNVTEIEADLFSRSASAGAFDVVGVTSETEQDDVFPPSRIHDLNVEQTSYENNTVILAWTAPGNNYDSGTAREYDLRVSDNIDELYDNIDNATQLTNDDLLWGNLSSPQIAGSRERVAVTFDDTNSNKTYAFSVRARDESDNQGDKSNVVFTTFIYIPPRPSSTTPATTKAVTTTSSSLDEDENEKFTTAIIIFLGGLCGAAFLTIVIIVIVGMAKCLAHGKRKKEYRESDLRMDDIYDRRLPHISYDRRNTYANRVDGATTDLTDVYVPDDRTESDGTHTHSDSSSYEDPITAMILEYPDYDLPPDEPTEPAQIPNRLSYISNYYSHIDGSSNGTYVNSAYIGDDGYF